MKLFARPLHLCTTPALYCTHPRGAQCIVVNDPILNVAHTVVQDMPFLASYVPRERGDGRTQAVHVPTTLASVVGALAANGPNEVDSEK